MIKNKTLFIVASGSGGHILPALVLAKKWKEKEKGKVIFFLGNKKLDSKVLIDKTIVYKKIQLKLRNFPGKKLWLYPLFFIELILSFFKTFFYAQKYKPTETISTGGYLAIPVCFASKIFNSFIRLYELNVVPGRAVNFLSGIANEIDIVFDDTKKYFHKFEKKVFLKNYPLRYSEQDKYSNKNQLIEKINKENNIHFSPNKKTLFLLGGSQGSLFLNNYLKQWLNYDNNCLNDLQIIHQTGINDKRDWISFYKGLNLPFIVFSYKQDLKDFYLIADEVITRAGAGTLFELEFFKKKSLIFPLISRTTSHQIENAKLMTKKNEGLFRIKEF